jgi:ribonuclease D
VQDIVTNRSDLERLALRLAGAEAIGLDTEFLRERTYRAELCLVQISDAAGPTCVDPLALPDLAPLAHVFGALRPLKVMHASRQDLEVLFPAVGPLQPVFDTQIAAALCGLPTQIGYGELVKRLLGRELNKAHTRTDWSRRPLSPEQVSYALDDVRYLLPLRAHLRAQIEQLGRTQWLTEELSTLSDPHGYTVDPEQAWLRIRGLRELDPARARLARALGAWRERRAVERNRPRGWILEDGALREIVARVPRSLSELSAIADMPAGVVKHCGAELLECIRSADVPADLAPTGARARPDPHKAALVKRLSAVHQATALELNLRPEVLATRRDLEQLADGQRAVPVLTGWRRAVIGERLLAAL